VVRRGATIYDIGANIGLFSVAFSEWIGEDGWLYAIEPNPACVSLLRANLAAARADNWTILPTALSDRPSESEFTLNYGNSLLGLLANAQHEIVKTGHHVRIDADRLDQLIPRFGLRKPDVIKLDVEGAEAQAVAGMMETLEAHRPVVVIELHGLRSATATLRLLIRLGYKYSVPSKVATDVTAEALIGCLRDECLQIIGHP
jgi:FkbM family methyltransferase